MPPSGTWMVGVPLPFGWQREFEPATLKHPLLKQDPAELFPRDPPARSKERTAKHGEFPLNHLAAAPGEVDVASGSPLTRSRSSAAPPASPCSDSAVAVSPVWSRNVTMVY